jgi:cellulose biosynthesis protein BcsE
LLTRKKSKLSTPRKRIIYDKRQTIFKSIMNDSAISATSAPPVRLGIQGLPNLTDSMSTGGLYILIAETPSARFPIVAETLASALGDNVTCTVIVHSNPAAFIQRVGSFGILNTPELLASNRLQFFEMQEEFAKKMFRFGADSFARDLEQFNIAQASYLLFDQADELLSLHDLSLALEQVEILSKWFAQSQITGLLIFSRTTEVHSSVLNALMDNLNGIARLGADKDGLELTFDYWQSPEGSIAGKNFRLNTLETGLYEASTPLPQSNIRTEGSSQELLQDSVEEVGTPHYFYMDPDLGSLAKQMAGNWQRVDTLVGMMHATLTTRSATCILSFQRDTNLRQLAEAVHTLRLSLGRHARIVVQEKGASLRYQNEALLMRLGLNLVVHRDVPSGRLPLLLESLKGQSFNRNVAINFEAALASVLPTRMRGYLLPLRFVREVGVILDPSETLNIPCAMIVGKPALGLAMTDVLTKISLSRPGDLISADNEYCYLFLNACPQSVMLTTLERILGVPVDAAFQDITFMVRREEIQSGLAALARTAEQSDLPDYSAVVAPLSDDATLTPAADKSTLFSTPTVQATSNQFEATEPVTIQTVPAMPQARTRVQAPSALMKFSSTPSVPAVPVVSSKPREAYQKILHGIAEDAPADEILFSYGETSVPTFGRKEAPRATRSSTAVALQAGQR